MKPMIDPQRDLAGATPETLARALLRPLRPRRVDGDQAGETVSSERNAADGGSAGDLRNDPADGK